MTWDYLRKLIIVSGGLCLALGMILYVVSSYAFEPQICLFLGASGTVLAVGTALVFVELPERVARNSRNFSFQTVVPETNTPSSRRTARSLERGKIYHVTLDADSGMLSVELPGETRLTMENHSGIKESGKYRWWQARWINPIETDWSVEQQSAYM